MNNGMITLADVDGTIPGRAALLSIDLDAMGGPDGQPLWEGAVEGVNGCTDPVAAVRVYWIGVRDYVPGHTPAVAANPRAKYLAAQRRLTSMGLPGYTPAEYVARHNRAARDIADDPDALATADNDTAAGTPGSTREGQA